MECIESEDFTLDTELVEWAQVLLQEDHLPEFEFSFSDITALASGTNNYNTTEAFSTQKGSSCTDETRNSQSCFGNEFICKEDPEEMNSSTLTNDSTELLNIMDEETQLKSNLSQTKSKARLTLTIQVAPSDSILCGTEMDRFLHTFVSRTKDFCSPMVNLNIIQKAVFEINSRQSSPVHGIVVQKQSSADHAGYAYFLASVSLGSLQSGFFHPEYQRLQYHKMNKALRKCYQDECVEVILAHLAIATFCYTASLHHEYKRHCGFATVLMKCLQDVNLVELLKSAYYFVVFAEQLPKLVESGNLLLSIFMKNFAILPLDFQSAFPNLSVFLREDASNHKPVDTLELDDIGEVHKMMKAGTNANITGVMLASAKFFRYVLSDHNLSPQTRVACLSEIKTFVDLVITSFQFSVERLSPANLAYRKIIEVFELLVAGDCIQARATLSFAMQSWDSNLLNFFSEHATPRTCSALCDDRPGNA